MNEKYDVTGDGGRKIVYVRAVAVEELPQELRAHAGGKGTVYALHDEDGDRLALVRDRKLAFVLARQNDLAPVSVH